MQFLSREITSLSAVGTGCQANMHSYINIHGETDEQNRHGSISLLLREARSAKRGIAIV